MIEIHLRNVFTCICLCHYKSIIFIVWREIRCAQWVIFGVRVLFWQLNGTNLRARRLLCFVWFWPQSWMQKFLERFHMHLSLIGDAVSRLNAEATFLHRLLSGYCFLGFFCCCCFCFAAHRLIRAHVGWISTILHQRRFETNPWFITMLMLSLFSNQKKGIAFLQFGRNA